MKNFRGYKQSKLPKSDEAISQTDPGTFCGEYLRRYWHPVALTSEVSTTPLQIRILGEDLVIFKTTENKIGLVHKNCPHRRASLVYGKSEKRGIRCCYHGWLFAPDGEILETPGEDPDSKSADKLRKTFKLGAYPVIEFNGLIFAVIIGTIASYWFQMPLLGFVIAAAMILNLVIACLLLIIMTTPSIKKTNEKTRKKS